MSDLMELDGCTMGGLCGPVYKPLPQSQGLPLVTTAGAFEALKGKWLAGSPVIPKYTKDPLYKSTYFRGNKLAGWLSRVYVGNQPNHIFVIYLQGVASDLVTPKKYQFTYIFRGTPTWPKNLNPAMFQVPVFDGGHNAVDFRNDSALNYDGSVAIS